MQPFLHPRVLAVLGVVNVLLAAVIGYSGWILAQAPSLDDFGAAPAFTLTDQRERPVSAGEFRGKVVVVNFIYTDCGDTCPLLSVRMQALQDRLRQEKLLGNRVQLLSFTVDPTHDTPAVLRAYAGRYGADPAAWRFLTGPEDQVIPVIVKGFFQGVMPVSSAWAGKSEHVDGDGHEHDNASMVMHSNRFVLIDRRGHMRVFYDGLQLDLDRVVQDAWQLLR